MTVCALVGAACFNAKHFLTQKFDYIVAVDGGYRHLQDIGVEPDLVIGDFDSLGYVPDHSNLIQFPERKNKSDIELALDTVFDEHYDDILIYGCLGGRLDFTFAVYQLIASFSERGQIVYAIGEDVVVRALVGQDFEHCHDHDYGHEHGHRHLTRYKFGHERGHRHQYEHQRDHEDTREAKEGFIADRTRNVSRSLSSIRFAAGCEGTLSIFSFSTCVSGLTMSGLEYELRDARLQRVHPLGVSNSFTQEDAKISVASGTALLFFALDAWPHILAVDNM